MRKVLAYNVRWLVRLEEDAANAQRRELLEKQREPSGVRGSKRLKRPEGSVVPDISIFTRLRQISSASVLCVKLKVITARLG